MYILLNVLVLSEVYSQYEKKLSTKTGVISSTWIQHIYIQFIARSLKINVLPRRFWTAIGGVEHGQCSSLFQLLPSKTLMPKSEAIFFYTQFSKEILGCSKLTQLYKKSYFTMRSDLQS